MFKRNRIAMIVAEFLGTGVLALVFLSVQRSQLNLAYFVALAAGIAVALLTYMFSNVSGAHFNPALTFALWTARRVRTLPALTYIVAQLLGAWAAYGLFKFFTGNDVQDIPQDYKPRIMVAEAVGAMVFTLGWAAAAYKRLDEGRFAAVAGLAYSVALILAASAAAFSFANPALALAGRAWEVFGENGGLNYAVGPLLGAVIGVNLYGLLFAESDRPSLFSGFRGRRTAASASTVTSSVVAHDDDVAVKPARKSKASTKSVTTSEAASKLSKSRKTAAARKTAASTAKRTTKK